MVVYSKKEQKKDQNLVLNKPNQFDGLGLIWSKAKNTMRLEKYFRFMSSCSGERIIVVHLTVISNQHSVTHVTVME